MNTIDDYIKWRGDLTFDVAPVNNIDIVIFSQITMLFLETLITYNDSIKFEELMNKYYEIYKNDSIGLIIPGSITDILLMASKEKRYKDLFIEKYINIIDEDKEEQFCALTIKICPNTTCVIFSGTDDTIVGWKENLNLLLEKDTHAQIDSEKYIENLYNNNYFENSNIIIAGHSKGGNLAMYAATNVKKEIQERIIKVFNIDGPGFTKQFFETKKYNRVKDKIVEIIPKDSVVGRLFEHQERQLVVNSNAKGLMQHDVFTWNIARDDFEIIEEISANSNHVELKIKNLIDTLDNEGKEMFINSIYRLMKVNNNKLLNNLKNNKIAIAKAYLNLSKEEKKIILTSINHLSRDGIIRNGVIKSILALEKHNRQIKAKNKMESKKISSQQ